MILINFISILVILLYCTYLDIKNRCIPNRILRILYIYCYFLSILEILLFINNLLFYFYSKLLILIILLIIFTMLFYLRIIRGGDLKVIFLLFFIVPAEYYFYFLFNFFFFSFFYILLLILFNLVNSFRRSKNKIYQIYFKYKKLTKNYKRFYARSGSKIMNLIEFIQISKNPTDLRDLDCIYNPSANKLQVITIYIFPLILVFLFSYLTILMILLFTLFA